MWRLFQKLNQWVEGTALPRNSWPLISIKSWQSAWPISPHSTPRTRYSRQETRNCPPVLSPREVPRVVQQGTDFCVGTCQMGPKNSIQIGSPRLEPHFVPAPFVSRCHFAGLCILFGLYPRADGFRQQRQVCLFYLSKHYTRYRDRATERCIYVSCGRNTWRHNGICTHKRRLLARDTSERG